MIEIVERIAVASVAVTARALAETAGSELTFLGWRTLVVVGAAPQPIRMSDLAERLGVSRPSASKLVRRLARRGLLELRDDPSDRRGLRVVLSEAGGRLHGGVLERRRQLIRESLDEAVEQAAGADGLAALAAAATRLSRWA